MCILRSLCSFALIISAFFISSRSLADDSFMQEGHFGVLGAITDDLWKGGIVYEGERLEAQVLYHRNDDDGDTSDSHLLTKIGYRWDIGNYNYFVAGAEYGTHPGAKVGGVSVNDTYEAGPYISLERYFSGSNLMLCLWVNPFLYEHKTDATNNSGVYTKSATNSRHYFQNGGFGIAYLF